MPDRVPWSSLPSPSIDRSTLQPELSNCSRLGVSKSHQPHTQSNNCFRYVRKSGSGCLSLSFLMWRRSKDTPLAVFLHVSVSLSHLSSMCFLKKLSCPMMMCADNQGHENPSSRRRLDFGDGIGRPNATVCSSLYSRCAISRTYSVFSITAAIVSVGRVCSDRSLSFLSLSVVLKRRWIVVVSSLFLGTWSVVYYMWVDGLRQLSSSSLAASLTM